MAKSNGNYKFRVSDAVEVPLRGMMLRLKLLEGTPELDALEPGAEIRLLAPDGESRVVRVKALSMTGGRASQDRLEQQRQLDVVIDGTAARQNGRAVAIGWHVVGS